MASQSAEHMAAKFLADLVKSREQASSDAIGAASSAPVTPSVPAAKPSPSPSLTSGLSVSQQLAAALQAKSDATDELMAIIDSGDLDVDKISALKLQITELNLQLKLLEAQEAQAKIAAAAATSFADDRVVLTHGPPPPKDAGNAYSGASYENGMLVDVTPATITSVQTIGPPPGYRTRKQREEDERERQRQEAERAAREGIPVGPPASGKHMKGDMVLSDTTLYVEPNWHTSISAGPTLECDPLCRSPLESVVVELLKHVAPGDVGRVGLTPDQASPRAYIHFLEADPATRLLGLLVPNATKLLCRVGTHEYRIMRAKPKAGQDYVLRPPCPQIWIRGTMLPDHKLLQNLSRFGAIIAHTRTAREVTVTFDQLESAKRAIRTLPTERQWWGAYINYAQQAQLISLKSSNPLPGVDLVSLDDAKASSPPIDGNGSAEDKPGEADAEGEGEGNGDPSTSMSGPRRHARRSRHRGPQHRRSPGQQRSPDGEDNSGPVRWPEIDIPQPKKEEPLWDAALSSPQHSRESVHHPERGNAEWGPRAPPFQPSGPPPRPQQFGGAGFPPPQGGYGPGPGPFPGYGDPYYRGPPMNGYGPPPPGYYNGPPGPPMNGYNGGPPQHFGYGAPPPGPYGGDYYGPPRSGPGFGPPNGAYGPPPAHYGPPGGMGRGGPGPGPGPGSFPPNGPHSAPFHPPSAHHEMSPPASYSAPPTSMHNSSPSYDQSQQVGREQQPSQPAAAEELIKVKPEPDADGGLGAAPTLPAGPGGKAAPVNFFRSTMDDSESEAPAANGTSGWAGGGQNGSQGGSFRPYAPILASRR